MKGLEAIFHYNGFSMAAVGVTIVFAALVVLSLIISQLHRLLHAWDNRGALIRNLRAVATGRKRKRRPPEPPPHQLMEEARQFQILIKTMGEPFSLPRLIRTADTFGVSRPHATASRLIVRGLIIPDQKGFYLWNHEAYNQLAKGSRR
jgi:hypothetical protein